MKSQFTGPIPGENFTSDTKNYPWHRPPEFTDLDKAIDMIAKRLFTEESSFGIITMLEMKVDVASITDMFLTTGIGAGKWTPDFALLLAGPTAHIICLMADGFGIDYDLGIKDKRPKMTSVFLKAIKEDQMKAKTIASSIPIQDVKDQAASAVPVTKGFMGMKAGIEKPPVENDGEMM